MAFRDTPKALLKSHRVKALDVANIKLLADIAADDIIVPSSKIIEPDFFIAAGCRVVDIVPRHIGRERDKIMAGRNVASAFLREVVSRWV